MPKRSTHRLNKNKLCYNSTKVELDKDGSSYFPVNQEINSLPKGPLTRQRKSFQENHQALVENCTTEETIKPVQENRSNWSSSYKDDINSERNKNLHLIDNGFQHSSSESYSRENIKNSDTIMKNGRINRYYVDSVSFKKVNGNANGTLKSTILPCNSEEKTNHGSNWSVEITLYLYAILSYSVIRHLTSSVFSKSTFLSEWSFEKCLSLKMIVTILIGLIADFFSLRLSLILCSLVWILLFSSLQFQVFQSLQNICILGAFLTSSPFIANLCICKTNPCKLSKIWQLSRLSAAACLLPAVHRYVKEHYHSHISSELMVDLAPILMSAGCAVSLFFISYVTNDESTSKDIGMVTSVKIIAESTLVKLLMFMPTTLAYIFYAENAEVLDATSWGVVCGIIQVFVVPLVSLCTSTRTLLVLCSCLLSFLFLSLMSVVSWSSGAVIVIPVCGLLCLSSCFLEVHFGAQLGRFLGTGISFLSVSHSLVRYLSDVIHQQVTSKGSRAAMIFFAKKIVSLSNFIPLSVTENVTAFLSIEIVSFLVQETKIYFNFVFSFLISFFPYENINFFDSLFPDSYSDEQNQFVFVAFLGSAFSALAVILFLRSK